MSGTTPLIEQVLSTSIRINGLLVPAKTLTRTLAGFCDPAVFHCQDYGAGNLFISGSAFRFKYLSRYFAVCTYHQLSIANAEDSEFSLFTRNGRKMITAHCVFFAEEPEYDLRAFEFTNSLKEKRLHAMQWWRATRPELTETVPSAMTAFCLGFPGDRNKLEFDCSGRPKDFSTQPTVVHGEMIQPQIPGLLSMRVTETLAYDPKGMSGSPVFGVRVDKGEPKCFWAGILANASRSVFNFLPAHAVGALIEQT